MLEEKLDKARRRSAYRTKKTVIGLLVAIALCGLVATVLYFVDFSARTTTEVTPRKQERSSASSGETEREKFKELLIHYQNLMAPRLLAVGAERWNPHALHKIRELKETAVSSFSEGNYNDALGTIQQLTTQATKLLEESDHLLQISLEKAASFLAEDLFEEARPHVNMALMIAPQSSKALELQQKVEKLPSLLPLLDEIKVARLENDLQKEYELLQQVVQISPERGEAVERIEVVQRQLQERQFAEQISLAFIALEKRQPRAARSHYLAASKVDPERQELALVVDQLLALEKSLRVELAVKEANQAVQRDDWQQAKMHFAAALKDAPHNMMAVEGKKKADLVVNLQERFSSFMKDPYRLADGDVRGRALDTLFEAEPALSYSYSLKKQAQELQDLIDKLSRRVPVIIESDNKTYILVRGVGKVGLVTRKQIELKPGNYIFEGRREGFKSKLVRVRIPYDQADMRLSVICDEPI